MVEVACRGQLFVTSFSFRIVKKAFFSSPCLFDLVNFSSNNIEKAFGLPHFIISLHLIKKMHNLFYKAAVGTLGHCLPTFKLDQWKVKM